MNRLSGDTVHLASRNTHYSAYFYFLYFGRDTICYACIRKELVVGIFYHLPFLYINTKQKLQQELEMCLSFNLSSFESPIQQKQDQKVQHMKIP